MKVQIILLAAAAVVVASCAHKVERRISDPVAQPVPRAETEYLKAHMQDGGLYLLSAWQVDDGERRIQGSGTRYDFNREVTETGRLELSLDSVALFETNAVRVSSSMIPLTVSGRARPSINLVRRTRSSRRDSRPVSLRRSKTRTSTRFRRFARTMDPCSS